MKFVGSKFDKSLPTKEIAARVRQEIKEAVKSGELHIVVVGGFFVVGDHYGFGGGTYERVSNVRLSIGESQC